MVPFYVLATAIVIGGGVLSYRQSSSTALNVSSQAHASIPPRPATEAVSTALPAPFKGEGAWVLAALPACLQQTQRVDGPKAFVHARLPSGAQPFGDGASLTAGNCRLDESHGSLTITRDNDRFKLSGDVQVYRNSDELVTYRERGQLAELRMYRILR